MTKAETFPAHLAPQSVNLKVQEVNFDHFILSSFFALEGEEGGLGWGRDRGGGQGRNGGGVLHGKRVMYAFFFFSFFSSWFCHTWDSVINSEIVLHVLSA